MNLEFRIQNLKFLALLILGSAFLVSGCKSKQTTAADVINPEAIVTQQMIDLTRVESLNGSRQYKMVTPLLERHDMAREPFMEFPNGVEITTYDSIGGVESTMRANYAIYYENRQLWEARGKVEGHNIPDGRTLRTEQLFWDQKMGRVYSNVNSYVEQPDGIHFGEGFESDVNFHNWLFRNYRGRVNFDPEALEKSDTAAAKPTAAPIAPALTPATPVRPEMPRKQPLRSFGSQEIGGRGIQRERVVQNGQR